MIAHSRPVAARKRTSHALCRENIIAVVIGRVKHLESVVIEGLRKRHDDGIVLLAVVVLLKWITHKVNTSGDFAKKNNNEKRQKK